MCVVKQTRRYAIKTLKIPEDIRNIVFYDEKSSTGLRHKTTLKEVGCFVFKSRDNSPECITFRYKNHHYKNHRVVWFLLNGEIPDGLLIDHIDRNPFNNKIENLRLVNVKLNQRNRKMQSNNNTGHTGVKYVIERSGQVNVVAYWIDEKGNKRSKHFNIRKLGHDEAIKAAAKLREEKMKILIANGEGYTDTHGI